MLSRMGAAEMFILWEHTLWKPTRHSLLKLTPSLQWIRCSLLHYEFVQSFVGNMLVQPLWKSTSVSLLVIHLSRTYFTWAPGDSDQNGDRTPIHSSKNCKQCKSPSPSETKKPQWHIQTMEDQTGKINEVQNERQPVTSLCVVCMLVT